MSRFWRISFHFSKFEKTGDPHIDPFDNGIFGMEKVDSLGIYSSGDYWLVKNDKIKIQGRYGTTIYTPNNMSALLALAFSGPWLWNDTLIIEPEEGKITYNGTSILTTFPAEFSNKISRLKYMPGDEHIDGVLKNYPVKMIQAPKIGVFTPKGVEKSLRIDPKIAVRKLFVKCWFQRVE